MTDKTFLQKQAAAKLEVLSFLAEEIKRMEALCEKIMKISDKHGIDDDHIWEWFIEELDIKSIGECYDPAEQRDDP